MKYPLGILASAAILLLRSLAAANQPPSVSITSPHDQDVVRLISDGPINFSVDSSDPDGQVVSVDYLVDGQDSDSVNGARYGPSFDLTESLHYLTTGPHTITARAHHDLGATTVSAPVTIIVPPAPIITPGTATVDYDISNDHARLVTITGTYNANGNDNSLLTASLAVSPQVPEFRSDAKMLAMINDQQDHPFTLALRVNGRTTYNYALVSLGDAGLNFGPVAGSFTTPMEDPGLVILAVPETAASATIYPANTAGPVNITNYTQGAHGSVFRQGTTFTYTPGEDFVDSDSFTYTLTDNIGPATFTGIVRNIWRAGAGSYQAVLNREDGVTAVGTVNLTVTQGGSFSGAFDYYGKRTAFTGSFSIDGIADIHVARFGHPPFDINLWFYGLPDVPTLMGSIVADDFQDIAFGPTAAVGVTEATAPLPGRYTLVLPAPTDTTTPQGDGYVAGQVTHSGAVHLAGIAGDGHTLSVGTRLHRDGSISFYAKAGPAFEDRVWGALTFHASAAAPNDCDGLFHWVVAPSTKGYYQAGFEQDIQPLGSRFRTPPRGSHGLPYANPAANATVRFTNSDGSGAFSHPVTVSKGVTATDETKTIRFSCNATTGVFHGTARLHGAGSDPERFSGVILQKQGRANGVIHLPIRTGAVSINPN